VRVYGAAVTTHEISQLFWEVISVLDLESGFDVEVAPS
jgi:hypothetical protein